MEFNADLQTCQDSRDSIRSNHGEWKLPIPLVYTSLLVVIVFKVQWAVYFILYLISFISAIFTTMIPGFMARMLSDISDFFTPGTGQPPCKHYTAEINKTFFAFFTWYLHSNFNSTVNYVPIIASQHVFRLYLCRSVYFTRCFIRLSFKF